MCSTIIMDASTLPVKVVEHTLSGGIPDIMANRTTVSVSTHLIDSKVGLFEH